MQEKIFDQVVELLSAHGLILKKGTIVDSTFIEAPSSTKNRKKEHDPEAHSAKKGNTWHFGYKAHIGVDKESGLVHTLKVTPGNVHDVCVTAELLTGEEQQVYGDSGYLGAEKRSEALKKNKSGQRIHYKINRRPSQSKNKSTAPKPRSNVENTKSPLCALKLNMFLMLSSFNFNFVKHDTGICESRFQN